MSSSELLPGHLEVGKHLSHLKVPRTWRVRRLGGSHLWLSALRTLGCAPTHFNFPENCAQSKDVLVLVLVLVLVAVRVRVRVRVLVAERVHRDILPSVATKRTGSDFALA